MGYLSIENLYRKPQWLQMFKMCYITQKSHGTSSNLEFKTNENSEPEIRFFSGGADHYQFTALFNKEKLLNIYKEHYLGKHLFLYGEALGGRLQGMKHTYGDQLDFFAFDARLDDKWLDVPHCKHIADLFEQKFVFHKLIENTIENLDFYRDFPSQIAVLKDLGDDRKEEGIVIRPIYEMFDRNGGRHICKHKRSDFAEVRSPREVDPNREQEIFRGQVVAEEFVLPMRLNHILDKHPEFTDLKDIPKVIAAMVEDLQKECNDEIEWSKDVMKAIGTKTVLLFKEILNKKFEETVNGNV